MAYNFSSPQQLNQRIKGLNQQNRAGTLGAGMQKRLGNLQAYRNSGMTPLQSGGNRPIMNDPRRPGATQQTGGPSTVQNPNRFTPEQRNTFHDMRSAYKPIGQGDATQDQISAFTGLRDPNAGLIDRRLGRIDRKINRFTNQNEDGMYDNKLARLNKRQDRLNAMKAYQAPAAVDPDDLHQLPLVTKPTNTQEDIMKALFPESLSQEHYDWQKDQGMKGLEKLMSARGLTNSGAEIEANSQFLNQLGAEHSDKSLDRRQTSADRLTGIMNNNADRSLADRLGTTRNINDLLGTMLSTNAFGVGAGAAEKRADNRMDFGRSMADMLKGMYASPGPTGGGAYPSFVPPMPNGPDFSGPNGTAAITGGANNLNFANDLWGSIASLF